MRASITKVPWSKWLAIFLMTAMLFRQNASQAQLPDCVSGTVMYGVFSPIVPTVNNDSTEIRSINYATGAIGPLMGNRRYYIRRQPGTQFVYGTSALSVSPILNKFFLITQMGTSSSTDGPKDIRMIDPVAPTATGTVIGSISTAAQGNIMDEYHFVKMGISSNGFGYAVGVHRSSTYTPSSRFCPVIRFSLCATTNCSTVQLIGYLPNGGIMEGNELFNGDIAFDLAGNLYFLSAAFRTISGVNKYTDTRLFRINAADLPAVSGTGTIPMSFVADFNGLDSTGASGIALDPAGNMYFSLRRYTNANDASGPYVTELHRSYVPYSSGIVPGYGPIPPNTSTSDLASCYFPGSLLSNNKIQLSGKYETGKTNLKWEVNSNHIVNYYEIQRSEDGTNFTTITTLTPENTDKANAIYQFKDLQNEFGKSRFYRIRQAMKNGTRFYSNVLQIYLNNKVNLLGALSPNPFIDNFNFSVELKSPKPVNIRLADQSGRIVYNNTYTGKTGENKFKVTEIGNLKPGIYFVEIIVENEVIRDKLVKQ